MSDKQFEKSVIQNCAATLAGLKVANLFNYRFHSDKECDRTLREMNQELNPKGVFIELIEKKKDFYLLYVYRLSKLRDSLTKKEIQDFLKEYGYLEPENVINSLSELKERFSKEKGFPHEIGAFLGYPLVDIRGFIQHKGEDFLSLGLWKVYGNKEETEMYFMKLNRCSSIYMDVYLNKRRSMFDMTITA